jgi:transcriptional regulator with XRE-family HTH domain
VTAIDHKALRAEMDRSGVTVAELARAVDISLPYASNLVAGRKKAKRQPVLRRRIADTLGVRPRSIEVDQ